MNARLEDCFFIQIGACSGNTLRRQSKCTVIHSYLHYNIIDLKWKGILVEPIPFYFKQLVENYSNCSGLIFENSAVNGSEMFYIEESDIKNELDMVISSVNKKHVEKYSDSKITRISVNSITFKELLEKHGVTKVDFLEIDTEGCDHEILQSIPFDLIKPQIIIYEHLHMTESQQIDSRDLLMKQGYHLGAPAWFHDTIAWRDDTDSRLMRFVVSN